MASSRSSYYSSYLEYFSFPVDLCFLVFAVFFILIFSWYINYESMLQDLVAQLKLLLMIVPLILLLLVHCLSGGLPFFIPLPEKDSLHRAGGSPWGIAILLLFLLFLISHQSYFQERWFPLTNR